MSAEARPAAEARLAAQLAFIAELDRMKSIIRHTPLMDASRRETDAEHSWHVAVMALLLAEHADEPVDALRVAKMLLIHDVVEIDAGDTFIYDDKGNADKAEREGRAADRLFGLLPPDQGAAFRALWDEFEARDSADARFAHAIDRFQPIMNNHLAGGGSWQANKVRPETVLRHSESRVAPISRRLWGRLRAMIETSMGRGDFPKLD
ncbi:5'-deoxynucleotidase YfbR [mine drainage metagenome]|uniref:5'-deoxynucleotidase n=1 Tax=mine drainage metagenome TaxID=410659 RepID=A0A1J5T2I8_9ZZZZ